MLDLVLDAGARLLDIGWNTLPWPLKAVAAVLAATTSTHALLNKRYSNSALGWIAVAWMLPLWGVIFYGLAGVNRVRARAQALDYDWRPAPDGTSRATLPNSRQRLVEIGDALTGIHLCGGNAVRPLYDGEEAYPAMLNAIAQARHRVWLSTYIFDSDVTGKRFVAALAAAQARGVDVRVLVDGIGERYARPRISRLLQRANVPVARFIPPRWFPPSIYVNLRNHRKILVADDRCGFLGGMNIGDRHLAGGPKPTRDVHFAVDGPVVDQLAHLFAHDWRFTTGETLDPGCAPAEAIAPTWCRTLVDGPDENLDRLRFLMAAAITNASQRVRIMSPYFLPTPDLVSAMTTAILGGVRIEVVLPSDNNLPYVHWAMRAMMPRLLARGVRIWLQPPPFAHSKLFLVDDDYALLGSANIDVRSLRLNFEIGFEVYDQEVTRNLAAHFDDAKRRGHEVDHEQLLARSLPARVRDGAAWLFSPYL